MTHSATQPRKVLVVRFSSIGDIVLTTPVVRCLKQQLPEVELHYLTKFAFRDVVAANPYIDKCYYLNNDWHLLLHQLQEEQYDCIIDLHHNLRTLQLRRALRIPRYAFNKLNLQKWLLTALKINRLPAAHIVDRYMATVAHLGVQNDGKGLDYFVPEAEQVRQKDLPYSHHLGYIAVVVGAAHATKRLPLEQLTELCRLLDHPLVLLGGKQDAEVAAAVAAQDPVKIYNACGKFSLNESADLVRRAKLVISHDTGLMHIAAAFKKPILSIWGNTVPAFGMTPYYGTHAVPSQLFEVNGLGCRPCSKIGHDQCPKGHFKCMTQQPLAQVAATAQQWAKTMR